MQQDHPTSTQASLHVLIIGGGIGGLCLAQGLKHAGISVAVYERDPSVHFRSQSYRIGLNTDGGRALRSCLPENLFNLFVATSRKSLPDGRLATFDPHLKETFSRPLPRPVEDVSALQETGQPESYTAVNRLTLRELLLYGLDECVQFDKTFERFEQGTDGAVRAFFTDGTSARGDLLIGADGTRSVTRQQLLPDANVSDVGFAIYGKTLLTPETMRWIPASFLNGVSWVEDPNGSTMMLGSYLKREPFEEAAAKYTPGLYLAETPDCLTWVVRPSFAQLPLNESQWWAAKSTTLHAAVKEVITSWHPLLQKIVNEADLSTIFSVGFRSAEPVKAWQTTSVTLLGDAIHSMTPFRGMGANTALRDAGLLRQKLLGVATKEVPLLQAVAEYETEMLHYGFEAVKMSLEQPSFGSTLRGNAPALWKGLMRSGL